MRDITVHVEFVDEQTGRAFAQTDSPLSLLPQSFEMATRLEMSGQQWDVVTAEPRTADQFAQSRRLVLTLRRVHEALADPQAILYSLPTICDAIPPVAAGTSTRKKHVFELHEDDWRHVEFVSQEYTEAVRAELRDIRAIYEETPAGHGYRRLHLRQRIPTPLRLPFATVVSAFPDARLFDGVAYLPAAGLIDGGFALDMGEGVLYGEQHQNIVSCLGLARARDRQQADTGGTRLADLAGRHKLLLVDWCRDAAFDAEGLDRFLAQERDE